MRSRSESKAVDLGDRGASLSESPDDPLAGHKLLPATTVSKVAGTPASRPSRSVPSRREPASRTSRRRRAQLRSWRPGRARSAYSESGAPPQMRSRQEISELSTTGSPVMQGMNGCDRYAPADLCLQPCKHLFGQTWTAVITRPATDDSDPCTGKRQEGRDRPDPAVSVNGRRTDRFLPPSRDDPARSRQPGRTI